MAWVAYEKQAIETGFNMDTMFDGFKELKAFAERQGGEMLQPKEASELKVLVKMMETNEPKALRIMKEWTVSVGGL